MAFLLYYSNNVLVYGYDLECWLEVRLGFNFAYILVLSGLFK